MGRLAITDDDCVDVTELPKVGEVVGLAFQEQRVVDRGQYDSCLGL
jgi:hypothetical protein